MGWPIFALAVVALLAPRSRAVGALSGDPRWALLFAAGFTALMATGGNAAAQAAAVRAGESVVAFPNPYTALSVVVPGLSAVRLPAHLVSGVHIAVSVLAGLGAAACVSLAPPRAATAAGLVAVAAAWGFTLFQRPEYKILEIRPSGEELAFFQELERLDNTGPLLEVPIKLRWAGYEAMESSAQVLLTSYHHRRTSGCYASFGPEIRKEIERLAGQLPQRTAVRDLHSMGFTTLVVRRVPPTPWRKSYARRLKRASEAPHTPLEPIHASGDLAAYELIP